MSLTSLGGLAVMTAVLILPVWVALHSFLTSHYSGLFSEGQTIAEKYGNLVQPVSGWQLAGIWPAGDFRFTAPALPTVPFIVVALITAVVGLWLSVRRRQYGPALYVAVVLGACGLAYIVGTTPWVLGKSLAISSPALLTAALTGAAMLWGSRRAQSTRMTGATQAAVEAAPAGPLEDVGEPSGEYAPRMAWGRRHAWILGPLLMLIIGAGVLWSNVLAYSDATLAPRARLVELQHVGQLVAGKGPTFINEYEAYADRHFLRAGEPVEPAEYRPVTLPLRSGAALTKAAWANINAFPLSTLLPYRSIVTRRSPLKAARRRSTTSSGRVATTSSGSARNRLLRRSSNTSPSANRTPIRTAEMPRTGRTCHFARSIRCRLPPARSCWASRVPRARSTRT